jgi:hypothetical protein
MVQPGTIRSQEKREELARNRKGKVVGRQSRLEILRASMCTYKMETILEEEEEEEIDSD